jgi:hypothetical protein
MPNRTPARTPPRSSPSDRPSGPRRVPTKKQRRRGRTPLDRMLRPWWQSPWVIGGGGLGAVVVVVVVIVLVVNLLSPSFTPGPAPSAVVSAVTTQSQSVDDQVGTGGQVGSDGRPGEMVRIGTTNTLKDATGRPEIIYVGAEFCPYCAAERWSIIQALSRFGTFSNLRTMESSSSDVYPDTNTFTFVGSTYTSQYVDFIPTEILDRNENQLQPLSSDVAKIYQTYDVPPYAGSSGYPFLDIGNRYTIYQVQFSPATLEASDGTPLTWQQISADLTNPKSPVSLAVIGNANWLTAAICITTGNQPAAACSSSSLQSMEKTLQSQTAVPPPGG